jgi:phospholipid/cholesterol/gamma-HCH transport system substrate-binding protein
MSRETYALLTGLFVAALGTALVVIAAWLGNYGEEREPYLVATQGSVAGLAPESTVLYRGVEAGRVAKIHFDPDDLRTILVRILVEKDMPITRGTYATLRVQPLTGLAQIELHDSGENPEPLPTSVEDPARIPLRPSLVDKLTESGQDILTQAALLATRLNELFDEESRGRMQRILASVETAAEEWVSVEKRLDQALAEWPALSAEASRTLGSIDELARDLKKTVKEIEAMAEDASDVLASGKSAGDRLTKSTLPKADALIEEVQRMAVHLRRLSGMLEDNPRALLLGRQRPPPGPGEPGFEEPR